MTYASLINSIRYTLSALSFLAFPLLLSNVLPAELNQYVFAFQSFGIGFSVWATFKFDGILNVAAIGSGLTFIVFMGLGLYRHGGFGNQIKPLPSGRGYSLVPVPNGHWAESEVFILPLTFFDVALNCLR